jgi:hypothetical protein
MSPRNRRLEQAKPVQDSPAKAWQRKDPNVPVRKTKFAAKDLPRTVAQHRAKPGMTSPQ